MRAIPGRSSATVEWPPVAGAVTGGWPAPYAEGQPSPWIGQLLVRLPMAMALLSPSGRIMLTNEALRATAGPECGAGAMPAQLVIPEDADSFAQAVARVIDSREAAEIRAALRNRPEQKQLITLTPIPPGFGIAALMAMPDIREQMRLEAQVAAATRMQAVGQLAGGVAHDFNNILTAVLALAEELLDRHPAPDPDHDSLFQIRHNGQRAAALVAQLLAFARQQPQRQQVLDPLPLILDLQPLLAQLAGPAIDLRIEGGPLDAVISADPGQIEQVIVNLAVNARDAMAGNGMLRITLRDVPAALVSEQGHAIIPQMDHVAIDVSDTGSGIPPAIAGKIFEPFFTTKPMGKGTGLGLSTAYGIVKQNGGYIFANAAKQGRGTVFSIYLPAMPRSALPADGPAEPPPPRRVEPPPGLRVLLVEDDAAVRMILSRGLTAQGLAVTAAADAAAALEILHGGARFDVLVSDVMMPGIDGVELAAQARMLRPDLPIVLMSGFAEAPRHRAADAQKVGFLAKPFVLADLVIAITEAGSATI